MKLKTMRRLYRREAAVMLLLARLAVRFVPPARIFAWARAVAAANLPLRGR